jgi:hypothetical protein
VCLHKGWASICHDEVCGLDIILVNGLSHCAIDILHETSFCGHSN